MELGKALAKEVPGEVLTTSGQFVTDKIPAFGLNQAADWSEYLGQVADTIGQTIIQSGLMMGGTAAANRAVRQLADRNGDATTGMEFEPEGIDAAARAALNPENARLHFEQPAPDLRAPAPDRARAQIEQILQQREDQAIASGDPLEVAVTRAENAAARLHADTSAQAPQTEAAPIDQQDLLQRARGVTGQDSAKPNATAPAPTERSLSPAVPCHRNAAGRPSTAAAIPCPAADEQRTPLPYRTTCRNERKNASVRCAAGAGRWRLGTDAHLGAGR